MTDLKRTFAKRSKPNKIEPTTVETRTIPIDAKLLSIQDASAALTEQYGGGYSIGNIRRIIQGDKWIKGWHYVLMGRSIKIYLPAVQDWQINGPI